MTLPLRRCVAKLNEKRHGGDPSARCSKPGVIYLGSGRFACQNHSAHGFVPVDFEAEDSVDEGELRRKRVMDDE